jgi:hypothetical protein
MMGRVSDPINDVQAAVESMHGCRARYERSFQLTEVFGPQAPREGFVESFALLGHPRAKRAYAWSFREEGGEIRYVAILELPPVTSPETAVRAAMGM